ncbi:hypothetical protein JCM10914A_50940 [Paenibacillus sp. JCM 10914]|uniref:hypothetical protein n=1 Tax=Paenibacillus sp. JCM 10914 TaxID=1236974 RepID=UPI0003CC38E7|nr:hypothetical protein [Paenibacillus sp. JCM 10914]GAE05207.1 hypothetical protein JCM10914_1299 [Paenibacillus sp. JCM 10914]
MIILISGVSSVGKTNMAQQLLEKYHVPYLSIDHLKMGLYRADKRCEFTPLDSNEHISHRLWPILKGIIMTNIENEQHLIIEGCYVMPHQIAEFEKDYSERIISVFLGFSSRYVEQNFHTRIVKYRNVIEQRQSLEETQVPEYIQEHADFRDKCLRAGVAYFEIDNDYDSEIAAVYAYIDAEIRQMEQRIS